MGNLSNLYISQSYTSLVHLGTDGPISAQPAGTLIPLQDGLGNSLGISLNNYGDINISGTISASNIPAEITSLPQFNAYTASTNNRLNNVESTTASLNTSVSSLNSWSASAKVSISALNTFTASVSTASIVTSITNLNQFTQSANIRLNNLETTSASVNISISNINATTASQQVSINALNAFTASNSFSASIVQLNQFTQSANIRFSNLEAKTGSYATTGSNVFVGTQRINAPASVALEATGAINLQGSIGVSSGNSILTPRLITNQIDSFTGVAQNLSISSYGSGSVYIDSQGNGTQFLDKVTITGAVTASTAQIAGLNYPSADNGAKSFLQTNGAGTLSFQYVDTIWESVVNGETTPLSAGTPVYVSGSSGNRPIVYRADASNPAKMPVTYVIQDAIASGANGNVIALGLITGITTTGYPAGTEIFVAEGGGWTASRPSGSASIVQPLGIVTKEGSGGSGRGLVLNPGPATLPNIQTGYAWVGNGTNQPVAVATSSFGGGGSTNTGSLLVTASAVDNVITFTKGDASTFQVQVSLSGSQGTIPLGTVSSSAQILAYGIFVTTSSFDAFTSSTNTSINQLNLYTSSTNSRLNNIELATSSLSSSVGSLNTYTQSTNVRLTNIEAITASQQVSINALNVYTASQSTASIVTSISNLNQFTQSAGVSITNLNQYTQSAGVSITNLNSATSSLFASASLALVTASFDNTTRNLTFTKGNTQTFSVNIPDVSGSTINTGSFATTGSNTFNGDQIINSVSGTGLTVNNGAIQTAGVNVLSQYPGINLQANVEGSGSQYANININVDNGLYPADIYAGLGITDTATANSIIGFASNTYTPQYFGQLVGWIGGGANNEAGNNTAIIFRTGSALMEVYKPTTFAYNIDVAGSLTASLANGYTWVGNSLNKTTLVATSSFGTPIPAGTISSSAQITALGFVSSSVTASSIVTASVNLNTITFTKGDSSTFALTVNTGSGGGGAAFPYAGTASISGSLQVTGSMSGLPITLSVVANTASIDMSAGNQFVLTLPSSSTTHIAPSAIRAGQTINLLIKQQVGPGTGSITFAPSILFPSGLDMQATATGSAIDLISMISFDTTNLMAANVKNLK